MTIERLHWRALGLAGPDEASIRAWLEAQGYRVARYVYPPGTRFPPHAHEADKIDAVLAGRFCFAMGGEEAVLGPGEMVVVPRGALHEAEVVGEEPVVSLDAVRA